MFANRRRLPVSRRLVTELLFFSKRIPHQAVTRYCNLSRLCETRSSLPVRIGWAALFLKAYGLLAERHPTLRQSFMPWPCDHIYQHPANFARLPVSREYHGELCTFFARIPQPENLSLIELQQLIHSFNSDPVEEIYNFRRQWKIACFPTVIRRLLWWISLNISGRIRVRANSRRAFWDIRGHDRFRRRCHQHSPTVGGRHDADLRPGGG